MAIKKSNQKVTKTNVSDKWISGVIGGLERRLLTGRVIDRSVQET